MNLLEMFKKLTDKEKEEFVNMLIETSNKKTETEASVINVDANLVEVHGQVVLD